jgi:predicted outer membrane repeat protein
MALANPPRLRCANHPSFRPQLEHLEDRSVPATFTVSTTLDDVTPANGKQSLREAITRANTSAGADIIVVTAGVLKIALEGAGEDGNATGDFDITDTVTIQGAGAGLTIIDGQQLDRVFDVLGSGPSSIKVVLQGLTIRNGFAAGADGGRIQVANADLVVRDCIVSGNRASATGGGLSNSIARGTGNVTLLRTNVARNVAGTNNGGGGIWVTGNAEDLGSVLTLKDSTVRRNVAGSNGGGGIRATTVTLTGSTVSGNSSAGFGGGIFATGATSLTDTTISNNFTAGNTTLNDGGGIWASTATLTNSTISGNSSANHGGGIFAVNAVTLTGSTVSGNSARGIGGGINANTATLTRSTVAGNTGGGDGGGIVAGIANLTGCTISGNATNELGGGINAGTATLTTTTVSGNSAATGGGLFVTGTAMLTRSTVSDNKAGGDGGGLYAFTATLSNSTFAGNTAYTGGGVFASTATLVNCTVAENLAHTGGGLYRAGGGASFALKNTIVALNLIDFNGSGPDLSGDFTSQGHNLIGDGSGGIGFTDGTNGDFVGSSANPIDPKLGPLANNGGPTKTMALLAGSPAIDHGDNAGIPATDQRGFGFARKKDGNGDGLAVVDIGAFEK